MDEVARLKREWIEAGNKRTTAFAELVTAESEALMSRDRLRVAKENEYVAFEAYRRECEKMARGEGEYAGNVVPI